MRNWPDIMIAVAILIDAAAAIIAARMTARPRFIFQPRMPDVNVYNNLTSMPPLPIVPDPRVSPLAERIKTMGGVLAEQKDMTWKGSAHGHGRTQPEK